MGRKQKNTQGQDDEEEKAGWNGQTGKFPFVLLPMLD